METDTYSVHGKREYDVDWLRVLGTLAVFIFHCNRFFDLEGWHVKNNELSVGAQYVTDFTSQWLMPLFFVLSAIATRHILKKRTPGGFLRERVSRLAVPFIAGTLVFLIPVQVYIERLSQGRFRGSLIDFYPHYFDGFYAFGGNFA